MAESVQNKDVLYEFGRYVLDPHERTLFADGHPVHLTDKVFDTLLFLIRNSGRILTKEEMMRALWAESFVEESNLAKNISRLRKIFDADHAQLIETVPRRGYRFLGDVKEIDGDTSVVIRRDMRVRITHTVEDGNGTGSDKAAVLNGDDGRSLSAAPERRRNMWLVGGIGALAVSFAAIVGAFVLGAGRSTDRVASGMRRLTDDPKHDTNPRWTHDGRIRFARFGADRKLESVIMNADGSGQTVVKELESMEWGGHWSHDGSKVIYAKRGDKTAMYLANADGSGEVALPFYSGNMDWSVDAKQIVYQKSIEADRNSELFLYSVETGVSTNITNHPGFDADPAFSPDGKQIVFATTRDGNAEIYLMNIDGSNVRRLTNHRAWDSHPVYSPDGTQIAINSDRENESSDIYLIQPDGTNLRRLTDGPENETVIPGGWSDDGTQLVITIDTYGNDDVFLTSAESYKPTPVLADEKADLAAPFYSPDGREILYQAALTAGGGEIRIFDSGSKGSSMIVSSKNADLQPRFSPDGEWIVYQDKIESNTEVCMIRKDGRGMRNLSNDPAKDASPSFSPDGQRIAFTSNRGDNSNSWMLHMMNIDGSDQRSLYPWRGWIFNPLWSPDGRTIIFAVDKTGAGNFSIVSADPDTASDGQVLTIRPRINGYPAFSPDGSKIAYATNGDGNWEIYLMNSDGTGQVRVTRDPADDVTPSFSPDGTKLIFASKRKGKSALYEVSLAN